jgi:type I site-specific restriction endonuclease
MVTQKSLSEDDPSAKFITPALYQAGWAEAAIRRLLEAVLEAAPNPVN